MEKVSLKINKRDVHFMVAYKWLQVFELAKQSFSFEFSMLSQRHSMRSLELSINPFVLKSILTSGYEPLVLSSDTPIFAHVTVMR